MTVLISDTLLGFWCLFSYTVLPSDPFFFFSFPGCVLGFFYPGSFSFVLENFFAEQPQLICFFAGFMLSHLFIPPPFFLFFPSFSPEPPPFS